MVAELYAQQGNRENPRSALAPRCCCAGHGVEDERGEEEGERLRRSARMGEPGL